MDVLWTMVGQRISELQAGCLQRPSDVPAPASHGGATHDPAADVSVNAPLLEKPGASAAGATTAIAIGVFAVAVAVVAVGLIGVFAAPKSAPLWLFVLCASGVVWAISAIVVLRRAEQALAMLTLSIGAALALAGLCQCLDRFDHTTKFPGAAERVVERIAAALLPLLVVHLLLALPDGRLQRRTDRRTMTAGYSLALAGAAVLMTDLRELLAWPLVALWIAPLLALVPAHFRYRRSAAVERRRLQWFGWSIALAVEVVIVSAALTALTDWPGHTVEVALIASMLVPLSLVAATVTGIAARVDRLLTRTVSLIGLTAVLIIAYAAALAAFGKRPSGGERSLLLLSMLAAAAATIAYQPASSWLTERANRFVYGERLSPDEALRTWGSRLSRAIPMDELLLQLVEALRKSMRLTSAQVWTGAVGHLQLTASVPHRDDTALHIEPVELAVVARSGVSGGTWLDIWLPQLVSRSSGGSVRVAPIVHGGELLGLIVGERPPDEPFSDDDDRVLTELSRQVGLALHNVQLDTALKATLDDLRSVNEALRASRTRIVAAGDAERRKLERNLHDGAQQHLVALAVKLRLAKDAVADDPTDAEAMIDEIRGNLQEAIAELRSLAHGIFPPLLMSGGLVEALPATASRAAIDVRVDIADVRRHPPEIEAAVYFCCSEALQNAAKHAGAAAQATLRLWETKTSLHWEVVDDGAGFDPTSTVGESHGFVNMRDRMGAMGGVLEVQSHLGGGTTVSGNIPFAG